MILTLLHRQSVFVGLLCLGPMIGSATGATLELELATTFSGAPVQPDSLRYENAAGERFSISRVSWLASEFAVQRADGSWLELTNQVAWFDLERRRTSTTFRDVPAGKYRGVRFNVGLAPDVNHADPTQFAGDHPLNPNLNNLHWSWQGGYIFLALEGRWRSASGPLDGWSYHFANDTNRTRVTLAAELPLITGAKLELGLDLATRSTRPVRSLSAGTVLPRIRAPRTRSRQRSRPTCPARLAS